MKRLFRGEGWMVLCVMAFVLTCAGQFYTRNLTGQVYQVSVSRSFQAERAEKEIAAELEWPKTLLPGERIDLNRAPVKDLTRLPQIGEKRAEAIIAWREENGGFQRPEELMEVSGIGEGIFSKIEGYITVGEVQ